MTWHKHWKHVNKFPVPKLLKLRSWEENTYEYQNREKIDIRIVNRCFLHAAFRLYLERVRRMVFIWFSHIVGSLRGLHLTPLEMPSLRKTSGQNRQCQVL